MNGMRVKLTFTFSAMGTCMPLVVTVTGLTEKEMPDGKEFTHNFFQVDRFPEREGAYLYHDPRRSQFIRSGKRTGGYDKSQSPTNPTPPAMWGFAGSGNEHERATKADE